MIPFQFDGRIQPDMPVMEGILVMGEGNPGALTVLSQLLGGKNADEVTFAEGYTDICRLDEQRIYGSDIWVGYKDVCAEDIKEFRKLIRTGRVRQEINELIAD